MPRAGVGIEFFVAKRVIRFQPQPRFRPEQANAVDAAFARGHMFLKPPAQPTKKVKLTVERLACGRVCAGQRVIAGLIKIRMIQRDGTRAGCEIASVEVDHIGQHGLAAFFAMEPQHLFDRARLTERVEQVFRVEAVVEPLLGCGGDQAVHGIDDRHVGKRVEIDPQHARRNIR